jgi:hypothetical protein
MYEFHTRVITLDIYIAHDVVDEEATGIFQELDMTMKKTTMSYESRHTTTMVAEENYGEKQVQIWLCGRAENSIRYRSSYQF